MKKVGLVVALLFLLVVGGVAAVVIVDPVGTMTLVGLGPESDDVAAARPSTPAGAKVSGAAAGGAAAAEAPRRPPRRAGASEPAAAAGSSSATPKDDPAPESNLRRARFVGPMTENPVGGSPHPELYPFTVARRTYPSSGQMTVQIAIRNSSGLHWKTAYIALRSARVEQSQLFEIRDWGIDEAVALDYTFPRAEVTDRMRELRVVSVTGEQRKSALAELLARSRQKYFAQLTGSSDTETLASTANLSAPGLLGLIGAFQAPFSRVPVTMIEPKMALRRPLKVEMPAEHLLAETADVAIVGTTEERTAALRLAEGFHRRARTIQEGLEKLRVHLGKAPLEEALQSPDVVHLMAEIRNNMSEFNREGAELATTIARSRDAELVKVNPFLTETSRRVLAQVGVMETAVKEVAPGFDLRGQN